MPLITSRTFLTPWRTNPAWRRWLVVGAIGLSGFLLGVWTGEPHRPAAAAAASSTPAEPAQAQAQPAQAQAQPEIKTAAESPSGVFEPSQSPEVLRRQYQELARLYEEQSRELAQLRQAIGARANGANPGASAEPANPGVAPTDPLKQKFYPLAPEEAVQLAKDCIVRVDQPALLDSTPGLVGDDASQMKAQPEEVAIMNRLMGELHHDVRERLGKLYEEALGHPANAELASRALLSEIQDKSPEGEAKHIHAAIARERAQQAVAPANLTQTSPYERAERVYMNLGDEFQERVSQELGRERADGLRAAAGGWPWRRSQFSGCDR